MSEKSQIKAGKGRRVFGEVWIKYREIEQGHRWRGKRASATSSSSPRDGPKCRRFGLLKREESRAYLVLLDLLIFGRHVRRCAVYEEGEVEEERVGERRSFSRRFFAVWCCNEAVLCSSESKSD